MNMKDSKEKKYVVLDGEFIESHQAKISIFDRAVFFGDSVFETIRSYHGKPFRLERHLERLRSGCSAMRTALPVAPVELKELSLGLVEKNNLRDCDAYLRVTVTGGISSGQTGLRRQEPPSFFIIAKRLEEYPRRFYEKGMSLIISNIRRNSSSPLSNTKTGNYADSLIARQEAYDRGADDSLMLTTAGNIAEATSSNIFYVRDGNIRTPDLGCGLLPGITREAIIEICAEKEIPVNSVTEGPEAIFEAEEVFLTNALMEVMPVSGIEDHQYVPCPGPVHRK
ncbi:MAG: aminotransferase class IV [Actinomycetota bacterium]|nr:aminotransferase class IV [Actinomycetota bacterium]